MRQPDDMDDYPIDEKAELKEAILVWLGKYNTQITYTDMEARAKALFAWTLSVLNDED